MSRRRAAVKREVLPDAKFGDVVLTKFMNCLMYQGKKSAAETIVYGAFDRIFAAALADDGEGVVDDPLGKALLAVLHHLVDQLLDEPVAVTGVGLDRPDGGC